jgi:DNA modification methylase
MIFQPIAKDIPGADAEIHSFEDTWKWSSGEAEREYRDFIAQWNGRITKEPPSQTVIDLMSAMRGYLGECSMMAYLVMMAPRLWEMRRVLKPTGSIYLHCDPTASHYLKLLMDAIFGAGNFLNEVIWKRTASHGGARRYGPIHDVLLLYAKTDSYTWTGFTTDYTDSYKSDFFRFQDENGKPYRLTILTGSGKRAGASGKPWRNINPTAVGRHWAVPGYVRKLLPNPQVKPVQEALEQLDKLGRVVWPKKPGGTPAFKQYLDDLSGVSLQDVITDIRPISAQSAERMGYPTQKPEALLERAIRASSNEKDVVLDPFCGCGTAVVVAERLHRPWIGIDITYVAINVMKQRFEKNGLLEGRDFAVQGDPKDVYSASELAKRDRYEFQIWCISHLPATQSGKRSGDKGVDGFINFIDPMCKTELGKGIISVKSDQVVAPRMVQELIGAMQNHNAAFGLLITLTEPTPGMKEAAGKAGVFDFQFGPDTVPQRIPKVQLLTVADLFKKPIPVTLPANIVQPFKTPPVRKPEQKELDV